jgi:hypothetical protein
MIKVQILDRGEFCDGEAYGFDCQDIDSQCDTFKPYTPRLISNGISAVFST